MVTEYSPRRNRPPHKQEAFDRLEKAIIKAKKAGLGRTDVLNVYDEVSDRERDEAMQRLRKRADLFATDEERSRAHSFLDIIRLSF